MAGKVAGDHARRQIMTFWSMGLVLLGVVLGGMVLVVIFSLLATGQKDDAYRDRFGL
jgi:hypothetical protein